MRSGIYGIFRGEICEYVGRAFDCGRRRRDHETGRESNKLLQEQIAEHGVRAFRWELLEECPPDPVLLMACEQVWIAALQPRCNIVSTARNRNRNRTKIATLTPKEWLDRFGPNRRMFPTAGVTS